MTPEQTTNMSRSKKKYPNGTPRGGTPGKATDTGFGAKGNCNTSKKNYRAITAAWQSANGNRAQ